MAFCEITSLCFRFPQQTKLILKQLNLSIQKGEFLLICGESGCGKTTLLRHLKPELQPFGKRSGSIQLEGKRLSELSTYESSHTIGYVMQQPQHQIVTDQVWHELAFGLENLGIPSSEIRRRTAEMSTYFGISDLFHKACDHLSGGQMQLLNLASILLLQPTLLLLDEPTAQLDPIAASAFLRTLKTINEETGVTIVLVEHHLEEAFSLVDRVAIMEKGSILCIDQPRKIAQSLAKINPEHAMFQAFPTALRIHQALQPSFPAPITIKEGKQMMQTLQPIETKIQIAPRKSQTELLALEEVHFRYEKHGKDLLINCSFSIYEHEICMLMGNNGSGKSTLIKLCCGILTPQKGSCRWMGKKCKRQFSQEQLSQIAYVPQDPTLLFEKDSVKEDLFAQCELQRDPDLAKQELHVRIQQFHIEDLLSYHPYDLSGGEQQKVAICKALIKQPKILLLDEVSKGLDAFAKQELREMMMQLKQAGKTIVLISHDLAFGASIADRCALLFDGCIIAEEEAHAFFSHNAFYTTAAHKISKDCLENAITCEEVIQQCLG